MYGTIAKVTIKPEKRDELLALTTRLEMAPGQIVSYVFRLDADPQAYMLVTEVL